MNDGIAQDGDRVLRQIAKAVPKAMFGTPELQALIARMSDTLRKSHNGVAIAAPQIGESYRIFVVSGFALSGKPRDGGTAPDKAFINPRLIRLTKEKVAYEGEGCLSVTGVYGTTQRAMKAMVTAQDEMGKKFVRSGNDLLAVIFQHEIDHLDGTLFIDHATDIHKAVDATTD